MRSNNSSSPKKKKSKSQHDSHKHEDSEERSFDTGMQAYTPKNEKMEDNFKELPADDQEEVGGFLGTLFAFFRGF